MDDLKHSQLDDVGILFEVISTQKHAQPSPVSWDTVISDFESPKINEKEIANRIRQHLKLSKLLLLSNEIVLLIVSLLINCIVQTFDSQNFIILLSKTLIYVY